MDFLSRDEQRHAVEQTGRAERRGAGAAGAEGGRERPQRRGWRARRTRPRGARRLSPRRPRPSRRSRPTSPIGRRSPLRLRRLGARPPDAALSRIDRGRHGAAARRDRPAPGARHGGARDARRSRSPCWSCPRLDLAIAFVQRVVAWRVGPRRLPRLDLSDGVPDDARTMVIVPTLLASVDGVARLLEHLEVLAHGNLDPRIHFAILSDFVDAPTAVARRRRRDPRGGVRRASSISICGSGRATPIASSCFIASAAGIRASASGWAGSASAARSRSSTGCCAAPTTRRSRRRSAISTCCRACATASRSTPTRVCRATPRSRSSASSRIR